MKRTIVFSRHPTHKILRSNLPLCPFRSVVRMGSTTELTKKMKSRGKYIECNTVEGIQNTSNKVHMKMLFTEAKISSPLWYLPLIHTIDEKILCSTSEMLIPKGFSFNIKDTFNTDKVSIKDISFPLIAKINFHSRGRGMLKIDNKEELLKILSNPTTARKYTFEKYVNFAQEYRVHATQEGVFYICRKLRKTDAADKWFFNSKNSIFQITFEDNVWIKDKFACFEEMEQHCIRALDKLKMDIAGFDIRVDAVGERFYIIEANSACSFGEHTAQNYIKQIPIILKRKYNEESQKI